MSVAVNGRFLHNPFPGGVHRAGREFIDALRGMGAAISVLGPSRADDERIDERSFAPGYSSLGLQVWEQVTLPRAAGGRAILSLANSGPLLAARHAVFFFDTSFAVGPSWFTRTNRAFMRFNFETAKRATVVMTASAAVADELQAAGIEHSHLHVVPLSVSPRFAPAGPEMVAAARARFGLGELPYLLHLGWADPRKNVDMALAVHRHLREAVPHQLVLIGHRPSYFAPVPLPSGATSVRRIERVTEGELVALLSGAAALLYPSRYEGFGLPPLEAAACGTAAIVSDLPVLRETAGSSAIFAPLDDPDAWVTIALRALRGDLAAGTPPSRSWRDAASEMWTILEGAGLT